MSLLFQQRAFFSSGPARSVVAPRRLLMGPDVRTHLVFGANTDVGKTIVSAGLVRASLSSPSSLVHYIKPLQCGGKDQAFIEQYAPSSGKKRLQGQTLFAWNTPVSPHVASRKEDLPRSDEEVRDALNQALAEISSNRQIQLPSVTWIETAGGVLSPSAASPLHTSPRHAPSGPIDTWGWSTQADLYQPILGMAPVVLVGDGRLGGIGVTLSAMESLIIRGYDIMGVILIETSPEYDNVSALREYASRQYKLRSGSGKPLFIDPMSSIVSLPALPAYPEPLTEWYNSAQVTETFEGFNAFLDKSWKEHVIELQGMRSAGRDTLWWPFTQHGNVHDDSKVTLIDSAHGDNFNVVSTTPDDEGGNSDSTMVRESLFDACASWWTQGLGHGESSLALASAAAAGRYGHVIFPDVVHSPALLLSQKLIGPAGPGHGWADRVFFTDDGSTAMEVAIKMGMKTFQKRCPDVTSDTELTVCAQQDCYHGDTLGVMDVAEPNVFNQGQHPWYEPKGLFLPTPTLGFHDGVLTITFPQGEAPSAPLPELSSVEAVMDVEQRLESTLYQHYRRRIEHSWESYEVRPINEKKRRIGSVVMEPIFMGAGGMKFVDPLWQRALMDVAKSKRIPIIFDEVASGLFRVGVRSCREILKSDPDIGSYAKLLTGGLVPLSVTLASEEVFSSYVGDEKSQALLHGHSYTAHPVGCVSAIHALEAYEEVLAHNIPEGMTIRQQFDVEQVKSLSCLPLVQLSFALGTVLAVTIKPDVSGGAGYTAASRTTPIIKQLRDHGVFARPLGNVIYIMASPVTSPHECARVCDILSDAIQSFGEELDAERQRSA